MDKDLQDLVVEIPADTITLGHDPDGLPKTDPVKDNGGPPAEFKDEPTAKEVADKKIEDDLVKALQADKSRLSRERDDRAREAQEARENAETERKAREAAEGESAKNTNIAMQAHWRSINADHQQIVGAISQADTEAAAAEREYAAAMQEQDYTKAAAAQRTMAKAESIRTQLEQGKSGAERAIAEAREAFATQKVETPKEEKKPEPKKPTLDDWISGCPDATKPWLEQNRDKLSDQKFFARINAFAQSYALDHDDAGALNSPEFVKALNAKMFPKAAKTDEQEMEVADDNQNDPVAEPKAKAKVTAAAPVSRSGNYFSSRNLDARQVRLPPKLAAFVKASGLDPVKYALGAVDDIKTGKLPKNFLDADYPHDF